MKRVFILILSLISILTFSLSSCSSSNVFKKVYFYGYGENETFYNELFEGYNGVALIMVGIFEDDYPINNEYGIQYIYEEDLEDYKSVNDYLSENKEIDKEVTPSNRQIECSIIFYHHTDENPLRYIAIYDCTMIYLHQKQELIEIIKFSVSDVIYKQFEK